MDRRRRALDAVTLAIAEVDQLLTTLEALRQSAIDLTAVTALRSDLPIDKVRIDDALQELARSWLPESTKTANVPACVDVSKSAGDALARARAHVPPVLLHSS